MLRFSGSSSVHVPVVRVIQCSGLMLKFCCVLVPMSCQVTSDECGYLSPLMCHLGLIVYPSLVYLNPVFLSSQADRLVLLVSSPAYLPHEFLVFLIITSYLDYWVCLSLKLYLCYLVRLPVVELFSVKRLWSRTSLCASALLNPPDPVPDTAISKNQKDCDFIRDFWYNTCCRRI